MTGGRGWLTIFAIVLGAVLLTDLVFIITAASAARRSLGGFLLFARHNPEISYLRLTLTTDVLAVCAIYWLLFSKHRYFRAGTIMLLLGLWPTEALLGVWNPFHKLGVVLGESFVRWAVECAVWVTYLQRSERVRVTFEHMVRAFPRTGERQPPPAASAGSEREG